MTRGRSLLRHGASTISLPSGSSERFSQENAERSDAPPPLEKFCERERAVPPRRDEEVLPVRRLQDRVEALAAGTGV
jgi:hypothetical protein